MLASLLVEGPFQVTPATKKLATDSAVDGSVAASNLGNIEIDGGAVRTA